MPSTLLTISILGYAVGPVAVALITDVVFQDDMQVGWSMAIVTLVVGPLAILLWMAARKALSKLASAAA